MNTAISRKRKVKVYTEDIDQLKGESTFASIDKMPISEEERKHYIGLALGRLNEIDATLITLYYFKELTVEEIVDITGFDKNNIKVKMFRARKRLAEHLSSALKEEVSALL